MKLALATAITLNLLASPSLAITKCFPEEQFVREVDNGVICRDLESINKHDSNIKDNLIYRSENGTFLFISLVVFEYPYRGIAIAEFNELGKLTREIKFLMISRRLSSWVSEPNYNLLNKYSKNVTLLLDTLEKEQYTKPSF